MFEPILILRWFKLLEVYLAIFDGNLNTPNFRMRHSEHKLVSYDKKRPIMGFHYRYF